MFLPDAAAPGRTQAVEDRPDALALIVLPTEQTRARKYREIKIYGKGAKERFVQIANSDGLNALCHYRENCKDAIEQADAFFVNRSRKPLSTQ